MSVGSLILRGLIVGIVAGLLAFGFAKVVGEPIVGTAINFESAQGEAERAAAIAHGMKPEPEEPEMFSREVQSGIGLFTGIVTIGAGIGMVFGVLFAFANGRMGKLGAGATSLMIAFYSIWSVYVIPALKYPPNPPSVGEPDTIKLRTGLYFLVIAISVGATLFSLMLRKGLSAKYGSWQGSLLGFLAYLVIIFVAFTLLPSINEVPDNFPAVTLYQFRLTSLGIQAILWGGTGLLFGFLAERAARSSSAVRSTAATA